MCSMIMLCSGGFKINFLFVNNGAMTAHLGILKLYSQHSSALMYSMKGAFINYTIHEQRSHCGHHHSNNIEFGTVNHLLTNK